MTCEKCGAELAISEWPWCPHGAARPAVHGDEIDYVDHNLGRHPVRITSKAQRRQLMAERGLVERVEHVPTPGSDKSPHTRSWAVVDLEAATALVSRGALIETPETADRSGVDLAWHVREDVKEWIDA
jgi:hypothetical protein